MTLWRVHTLDFEGHLSPIPVSLKQAESPSEEKKHGFAPHTSCMWPLTWGHIVAPTLYFQLNSALSLLDSVGWIAGGTRV